MQPTRLTAHGKFFLKGTEKVALKGVTYGPFEPRTDGYGFPGDAQIRVDLDLIRDLGANTLRLYELPPTSFLDHCQTRDLQVFLSIPWTDHVDFMHDRAAVIDSVPVTIAKLDNHPAIAGYFVGNEIQATMVRWLGAIKVKSLLEDMITAGKKAAPDALFAYANYPSTEYLNPDNADFLAFNIYLEDRAAYARYLTRLQNIAGDKPLLVTEFGIDTNSKGNETQAETHLWQTRETFNAGAAGTFIFAFTDAWYRGGTWVTGWDFGLTDRNREPKPAYHALADVWKNIHRPADAITLERTPRISIIVCTYNGQRTLRQCLASLKEIKYPDYEIIVVDDGSSDSSPSIVCEFTGILYAQQRHGGLSAARNRGAREATGEILAYTDDDCIADDDWLTYLAHAFLTHNYDAAGGPNIPPPPVSLQQACVTAAPGAPSHVLLNDRLAEHLPGCNLVVTAKAFHSIGGFSEEYHTAGDDVDFCWRLEEQGGQIGFVPGAFVWHHRRVTARAYLRQQIGYGKAEAILIGRHAHRFGRLGGARWKGVVYQNNRRHLLGAIPRIYQGVFGYAPFQAIYAQPMPELFNIATSFPWIAALGILLLLGFIFNALWLLALPMVAATLTVTIREALAQKIVPAYDGPMAKILLSGLSIAQPILRSTARYVGSSRKGVTPRGPWFGGKIATLPKLGIWKRVGHLSLWSTKGYDRDHILARTVETLKALGWRFTLDNGWRDWDLEIRRSHWWMLRMTSVTEYHGGDSRLTRVRFTTKATTLNLATNILAGFSLLILAITMMSAIAIIWIAAIYLIWWIFLEVRHRQLVESLAQVVVHLGHEIGFDRIQSNDQ
jgi:glycosyltransferase involved in cell wall biosynthesis